MTEEEKKVYCVWREKYIYYCKCIALKVSRLSPLVLVVKIG